MARPVEAAMRVQLAAICCAKGAIEENLVTHLGVLDGAAAAGCDLVLFPEMSLTGSADPASTPECLVPLDHPAVARLTRASGDSGVAVCFGVAERSAGGVPHITQVVAADGQLLGVQRKRHLGEGEEAFTAATDSAVFEHAGIRFAVAICAEAGCNEPFDDAVAAGARLVLFPAAPASMGGAATRNPGAAGLPGGRAAAWVTRSGTPGSWACGSRRRARPAPPWTRTSPVWPLSPIRPAT